MAVEVADGVVQLAPLPYVNCVAIRGADGWTLVDTGLSPTASLLVRQLRRLGIGYGDLERIVLTHAHLDHAGGAAMVRAELGAREVLIGTADVQSARAGENQGPMAARFEALPLPVGEPGYPALPMVGGAPDEVALGDDRVARLVPTPGHTPGHTSVHLPELGIVVGGDAVFNVFRLTPSPGFLCSDVPASLRSITTIADLAPSTLLLAHGTPVTGDVEGRLRQLAADA